MLQYGPTDFNPVNALGLAPVFAPFVFVGDDEAAAGSGVDKKSGAGVILKQIGEASFIGDAGNIWIEAKALKLVAVILD
jgi:hypothetical protein